MRSFTENIKPGFADAENGTREWVDESVDVRCPTCERPMGTISAEVGTSKVTICHHCRYRWYAEVEYNPDNTTDALVTVSPAGERRDTR
jgi:hypothetical protein